jgi:hypothetical protein
MRITIEQLIEMCKRRLISLQSTKASAMSDGNVDAVIAIEEDIEATEKTLRDLTAI